MLRVIPSLDAAHLQGILDLQSRYLYQEQSPSERKKEGFVTIRHHFQSLHEISGGHGHIVALDGDKIVGYALFMDPTSLPQIPVLAPLERKLQILEFQQRPVWELPYFVMGQICIDKNYRRRGIFKLLYYEMRACYANQYTCVVTEIAAQNQRSLGAHLNLGFQVISSSESLDSAEWITVAWGWK